MDLKIEETPTRLQLTAEKAVIERLRTEFHYRPPDYWRSPQYQLYKATLDDPDGPRGWDGYKNLIEWADKGRRGMIFRGHKEALLRVCEELGVTVTGNYLESPFVGLTVDDVRPDVVKAKFELDHLQKTCVVNLLKAGIGTIQATVSSGKTVIFAAVAAMAKSRIPSARILYVVPTERLVNQVFAEMTKFLPKWRITQAGGGKKNFDGGDMVVATMATLYRNAAKLLQAGWFQTFTMLLVDECHHAPASTWSTVIRLCPAFFRYGASDSVKDERPEDIVAGLAIRGFFGPVRATIDVAPLIALGRVAKPNIYLVDDETWYKKYDDLPHRVEVGTPAWCLLDGEWYKGTYRGGAVDETKLDDMGMPLELTGLHAIDLPDRGIVDVESRWCLLERAYDVGIIRFKPRNAQIREWATHFAGEKKWPTLVVATRTLHVLIIEKLLQDAGLEVATLTGEDTTKKRDKTFDWVMNRPGRVLVSPLVKEGVSLPELRGGIVADSIASPDLARQVIGRFIRKKPTGDNTASIVFFIDRQYTSARKNSLNLFRELEKIRGYTFFHPAQSPTNVGLRYEAADFT